MNKDLVLKFKSKAARYCANQERAPVQVMEKLLKWGLERYEATSILNELIKENFINEKRFALAYCGDKFKLNRWGKFKIQQAIKRYEISPEYVQFGLDSIEPDQYISTLKELATKKYRSLPNSEPEIKSYKVQQFLMGRGFEYDLIHRVLKTIN